MLDNYLRPSVDKVLVSSVASFLARLGIKANYVTLLALLTGLATLPALLMGWPYLAVVCLLLSGYCDMLDGALARLTQSTSPLGTVFDIVSDRCVELAVMIALLLQMPAERSLLICLMLGSSYLCITSFLVVAIFQSNEGQKGFHYSPGLMERLEAFIVFILMIIWPWSFNFCALFYIVAVFYTAILRVWQFYRGEVCLEQQAST